MMLTMIKTKFIEAKRCDVKNVEKKRCVAKRWIGGVDEESDVQSGFEN